MLTQKTVKILIVFGTRPEAIKLTPVIQEMRKRTWAEPVVCTTAQHRQMLDQMLEAFSLTPDIDLNVMTRRQSLYSATGRILAGMQKILEQVQPHLVIVQGDTTTTFAASLASFYEKIPVAHVEAGLRTRNRFEPFPEEMNRKLADSLAEFYFAATEENRQNLLREDADPGRIFVVGNTVVDALKFILKRNREKRNFPKLPDLPGRKVVAVTAHRRESFGKPLESICHALLSLLKLDDSLEIVYPVHLNPNVARPVRRLLGGNSRIHLLPPLDYFSFIELLRRSALILTDSGGVQEEAPTLKKPVVLLRDVTERPEGVHAGFVKIAGTDPEKIIAAARQLLEPGFTKSIRSIPNPYGDGRSAQRIAGILSRFRNELISRRFS
jgi:UDP-N-acetylglucosamine 2-epimerase (non-hydrolysing)